MEVLQALAARWREEVARHRERVKELQTVAVTPRDFLDCARLTTMANMMENCAAQLEKLLPVVES